jgi:hypothetical protein
MNSTARWAFAAIIALAMIATVRSDEKASKPPSAPAFEALKKLAGDWVADDKSSGDHPVMTSYKLISSGSVLQETLFPGTGHEMVSMYHMDGPDLVCTHYCALGNQPRLKYQIGNDPKVLVFKSVSVGNSKSMNDMHMGFAEITLVDDNHYKAHWKALVDQKPDPNHNAQFSLVRKAK